MKFLSEILKSALWGITLLFLVLVIIFNLFRVDSSIAEILPSNYMLKVENTIKVLKPEIEGLKPLLSKYDFQRTEKENQLVAIYGEIIRRRIAEICSDCNLPTFRATEKYELESYMEQLNSRASKSNIDLKNRNEYLAILFSCLCVVTCIYLIYSLIAYRKNSLKLILVLACFAPILLTTFAFGSLTTSEYFSTQLGYQDNSFNYWLIGISILYVFAGYPAIYTALSRKSISLIELLKFSSKLPS